MARYRVLQGSEEVIGMNKADHSGHRDRLRTKYLENGVESLAPHEIIEMLLFNAVPYRNTNDIAKILLDRFGSLSGVLDAAPEQLMDAGLTRNQAAFLKLIPDVTRLYLIDRNQRPDQIVTLESLPAEILNRFIGQMDTEHVFLLLVDKKMKEIYSGMLTKGSFNASEISLRRIVDLALRHGAVGAVLAHNHPSGLAMPSSEDLAATERIRQSLRMIGVELIDHYIVADGECVSLRDSGLFN